jgi:RNA polymerase sigma-70 factor (ECF subfamily)
MRLLAGAPPLVSRPMAADDQVEQKESVNAVRLILDQLPERDRQLLLMREEGFKYEEIARVIGVAPASVGTLIARALRKFTTLYESSEVRK